MAGTFANNALSSLYVVYEKRFGLSSLSVTMIFATYALAVLAALLVAGRLSDDIGRKPLLLVGALLLLVSSLIFLFTTGVAWLYLGRAVVGLATGTLMPAATAALVELEPNHDRGRASLLTTIAFLAGAAFGPLLAGVAAQYVARPLRTPFIGEIVLQLVALVGVCLLTEPAGHQLVRMRWRLQRPSVPKDIRTRFAVAGVVVTIGWMVGGLYGSLSGSLDEQLLHVHNRALAGIVLFIFSFIGGASQFLFRARSARQSMVVGVVATIVGIACVEVSLFATSAPLFLVATIVTGVGNGLCFIGSLALVNQIAHQDQRAETVAAYNVVAYFALSLPVVGVGLLANAFGLKSATLLFAGVLLALSVVSLVSLDRLRPGVVSLDLEPEPTGI